MEIFIDGILFLFELFLHYLFGFTQMLATALWQTNDATIIAKRNVCLALYGSGFILAVGSVGLTWFGIMNLLWMLCCLLVSMLLLVIAGSLADEVEKLVLQQKTLGSTTEGFENDQVNASSSGR